MGRMNMMKTDMAFCDVYNPPLPIERPLVYVIASVDAAAGMLPSMPRLRDTLTEGLPKDRQQGFRLEALPGTARVQAVAISVFPESALANTPGAVTMMVCAILPLQMPQCASCPLGVLDTVLNTNVR
jgi:hypothetical protein